MLLHHDLPPVFNSYAAAEQALYYRDGRHALSRKLNNRTFLVRTADGISISMYDTYVATWTPLNLVVLRTNGWFTSSTRERMNDWLPFKIRVESQHPFRGFWYADLPHGKAWFHDNMVIDLEQMFEFSTPYNPTNDADWNRMIMKSLKGYIDGFGDAQRQRQRYSVARGRTDEIFRQSLMKELTSRNYPQDLVPLAVGLGFLRSHYESLESCKRGIREMFQAVLLRGPVRKTPIPWEVLR